MIIHGDFFVEKKNYMEIFFESGRTNFAIIYKIELVQVALIINLDYLNKRS